MQRNRIIYTALLSIVLSDTAFSADQDRKADTDRNARKTAIGHVAHKSVETHAKDAERIRVRGHLASIVASSATK